jgi:hypothetical protein
VRVALKVTGADDDEAQTVSRYLLLPAPVVKPALLATMDSTRGHPIRLVEVRNRLVVLTLPVLDDETVIPVVGIDGQADAATTRAAIPQEPVERC